MSNFVIGEYDMKKMKRLLSEVIAKSEMPREEYAEKHIACKDKTMYWPALVGDMSYVLGEVLRLLNDSLEEK